MASQTSLKNQLYPCVMIWGGQVVTGIENCFIVNGELTSDSLINIRNGSDFAI